MRLLLSAGLLLVIGCSSVPPETQLLMDFFEAARLGDATVLAKVATVGFNPTTVGAVQDFELVTVAPPSRRAIATTDAEGTAAAEAAVAVQSLTPPGNSDIDISTLDVDMVSEPVTVRAQVRTPDGRTEPRTLVFTFQRASARRGDETIDGRWIITGIASPSD